MLVKFWGVHGSLPRPGPSTLKYGGNTACVEVRCGDTLLIFDAGTGIRDLGEDLLRRTKDASGGRSVLKGHILFSHLHWDHVQGFPFFGPAFVNGNEFHLYGGERLGHTIHRIMSDQMAPPNFPVLLDELGAHLAFHNLDPGDEIIINDVRIITQELNHPGGCLGYRVENRGKILVYASDTEHVPGTDSDTLELARGSDILIFDTMFTREQYLGLVDEVSRESWGHSTWEAAVSVAVAAGVKHLVLFHHGNDDRTVEEIERRAREKFPRTTAAYEGLELEI